MLIEKKAKRPRRQARAASDYRQQIEAVAAHSTTSPSRPAQDIEYINNSCADELV